jgi:hypothetical protein
MKKPTRSAVTSSERPGRATSYNPFVTIDEPGDLARQRTAEADRLARGSRVERFVVGPIDIRATAELTSFVHWETQDFSWGQLIINVESSDYNEDDLVPRVYAETEVRCFSGGGSYVHTRESLGQNSDVPALNNPGELLVPFPVGLVPDSVEVWARARIGGGPLYWTGFARILTLSIASRWHR